MPLDFAKTVLQTGGTQPIQQVFANAIRDKGVGGLFAGMVRTPQRRVCCVGWQIVIYCAQSYRALYSAQLGQPYQLDPRMCSSLLCRLRYAMQGTHLRRMRLAAESTDAA